MRLLALKNANLALAFLLELGVLAALVYWGWAAGPNLFAKIGLSAGAAAAAIVVWAVFGAPRSSRRLQGSGYWLLRISFDAAGALALYTAGQRIAGVIFALVAIFNCAVAIVWKQAAAPEPAGAPR